MTSDTTTSVEKLVEDTLTENGINYDDRIKQLGIPYSSEEDFAALRASIRKNGLKQRIRVSASGIIIDGRERYAAMLLEGMTPTRNDFITIDDDNDETVLPLIFSLNVVRKHLSTSQIAMIYARNPNFAAMLGKDGLRSHGTSVESVERAKRVLKSGDAETIKAVQQGELAVSIADRMVSGRVPKSAKPRAAAAAVSADQQADAVVQSESAPKRRGRPSGNARVNALKRLLSELAALDEHKAEIDDYWHPTRDDAAFLRRCIELLECLAVNIPTGATADDADQLSLPH